ncbi:MAG: response regulator, partial [Deltaproteobacteria bacterium]|nr:response regulator [Deltaproteobacteria bacterium]
MARILIVDDDQKYCKMLSYLFSSRGYETRSVNSGEEAIAVMEGRAADVPGVVIVDVMMRGMSGYDTIVKLKDIVNMEHTGIIVISGLIGEV